MLVTIFLVVTVLYGSVEAPPSRGFSYIELWYIGVQMPILIAMLEYGIILAFIKYRVTEKIESSEVRTTRPGNILNNVDLVFFFLMSTFIFMFDWYYIAKCSAAGRMT